MRHGDEPFLPRLYVDDGIFADVLRRQRMNACTDSWGGIAKGLLGPAAINQDKLDEESVWKQQHVILGFNCNTSNMTITLPEAEIVAAQILTEGILQWKGTHIMLIKSAQQLRGRMEHFGTTNPAWRALAAPVDDLLTFGDGNNDWVSCHRAETWNGFWYSMSVIETRMADGPSWKSLSRGSFLRLLPPPAKTVTE